MNKLFVFAIGALALTTTMASEAAPAVAALPCEVVTTPTTPSPAIPAPSAPANLRILNGGGSDDDLDAQISGPYVAEAEPMALAQTSPHAYYLMLASRSDCIRAYSLRDPLQLATPGQGGFAHGNRALAVTYDPLNDLDPRKQDAAKVIVGTGSNSLTNQVRLPIPAYGSSLFVTWDAWFGKEFAYPVHGIQNYKTWQFASPADQIWTEVRNRFSLAGPGQVGKVDVRYYGSSFGSGTFRGSADSIAPQSNPFDIAPETWTRYFVHIEALPSGFYAFSLWMADANRGPVVLLDRREIKPGSSGRWESFWIEFNTSTSTVTAGRPSLVAYVRNVVMLGGITNVASLLQRP